MQAFLNVSDQKMIVFNKNLNLNIDLKKGKVEELNENIFMVLENKIKYRFKAQSAEDKQNWVIQIKKAIFINDSAIIKVEIIPKGLTKQIVFTEVDQIQELEDNKQNKQIDNMLDISIEF